MMKMKNNFPSICHPDDRREEGSRVHIVNVYEILRRHAPLNDNILKLSHLHPRLSFS